MLQIENTLFTIVMLLYFTAMILYFTFVAIKRDGVAKAAVWLQIAGLILHTAALVCRGIGAGPGRVTESHPPWYYASVAQRFARRPYKPKVPGSSPGARTILSAQKFHK